MIPAHDRDKNLNQGSPEIQRMQDYAWLNKRCLPGSLRQWRCPQDRALVVVKWSIKVSTLKMTPFLNQRLRCLPLA
eukprot:1156668-Pelagomonas_calceolata.AAC.2